MTPARAKPKTKKSLLPFFFLPIFALGAAACAADDEDGHTIDESQGAWGHLALDPRAPQFLVNKRPGQTFRACVPRYLTTELPGFEAELDAAVNVWAHYIGRRVEVQIAVKDLPRATAGTDARTLARAYHEACGAGFDAVFGFAPFDDATLGATAGEGTVDRQGTWLTFERFVFLRDFALTPDDVGGVSARWTSFSEITGRTWSADTLLAAMKERSFLRYLEGGRRLSLPVLAHEIGHVWGLCDQYESARNCDPRNSTSHLAGESLMGPSTVRERAFLTDDDVEGIRALARRPGFDAGWPAPPSTAPAPIVSAPVELFRLDEIQRRNGKVVLGMGLVANVPVRLELSYRAAGTTAWHAFQPMVYEGRTDVPLLAMTLPVDASLTRIEVRGVLSTREGTTWTPVKTVNVAE